MTSAHSPLLARIEKGRLCAGCGACVAIAPDAISMQVSADGFLRPVQSGTVDDVAEDSIAAVCPALGLAQQSDGRADHTLWGPYVGVYSGHATDPELRRAASSGGALSAVLSHLLSSGTVDQILHVAADAEIPFGNDAVLSFNDAGILAGAGSRYAPSAPMARVNACVDTGLRYAFVGKPCDVAALVALRALDPEVARAFPVTLSFFCAGVPSLNGAREVLNKLAVEESELAAFRYRGNGWPGFATATRHDGSEERMSYADSWGGILSRHVQFRCKICPDGTGGFADIVCADAWEVDDRGYPLFGERDGVSLVLARSDLGDRLVKSAKADGVLTVSGFDIETLQNMQPGQTQKRRYTLARLAALYTTRSPAPKYRGFHLWANARRAGMRKNLRNYLGTLWRVLNKRLQ